MNLESPVRRLVAACALLATSAAAGVVAHADQVRATPGTHRFTTTDAKVAVLDGPTGTHATTIDTRLYVPDNATAKSPQPAVLMTHGFGLTKASDEVVGMATFLARHGYVVLTYTSAGFGASSGCISLQSRTYDVKDAQQLITKVLQPQPYVKKDAKGAVVGTVGGSYGGGIQGNLAEADPRIRAIVPGRTWNTLQYSLDPNNWVVPGDPTGFTHTLPQQGVFKKEWTSLFFGSGMGQPVGGLPPTGQQDGGCVQDHAASDQAGLACTGFLSSVCQTYARLAATGDATDADRALIADASPATQIAKLRVPTLLVQGEHDTLFNVDDAVATYTALRAQHVPVQMIWNWGGHGGYGSQPGECEVYGGGAHVADNTTLDSCYLPVRTLAFLDHWLRGKPDRSPGFSWFQDWGTSTPAHASYGDAPSFPLAGTSAFDLTSSGGLLDTAVQTVTGTTGHVALVNPPGGAPSAYSETANFTGPDSSPNLGSIAPREVDGQFAAFATPPLPQAVVSVGVPALRLRLSHTAPTDLWLFAKVYDVAPDGTADLIDRQVAPSRIPSAALAQPVDLKLVGFAHRFAAGHQIRLVLCTTDSAYFNNPVADVVSITTGTGAGSSFTLPYRKA